MRVDHLINGKPVAGTDYFETVNPATQEVLAEVAAGGAAEVDAAVAAAKAAFPAWAATPAPQRARLIRRLGELLADHRRLRVIALRAYGVRVDLATREAASPPQPRRTVEVAP